MTVGAAPAVAAPAASDGPGGRGRALTWWALGGLIVLVLARGAVHAWQGTYLVLDDWSIVFHGQGDFWGALSPEFRTSRPGAWLILTVGYGAIGPHPLVLLAAVTALNALLVVLVYLVASKYLPPVPAIAVPALWVLMASHASLSVWGATMPALVALCLLAAGVLALHHGRWAVATVLLCAGSLCYELVLPAAAVTVLLVGDRDDVPWSRRGLMLAALGATGAWISAHSIYPVDPAVPPLDAFWDSLAGRGLLGVADPPVSVSIALQWLTLAAGALGLVAFVRGDRARDHGPWLVVVGIALVLLGASAWVNLTGLSVPLGQSDRVNALSAFGVAAIWVGAAQWLWQRGLRVPVLVAAAVLCAITAVGQVVTMASWSRAGEDVVALFPALERFQFHDARDFVVGPDLEPITHGGVSALGTEGFADAARDLVFAQGAGTVTLVGSPLDFTTKSGTLVDWSDVLGGTPYDYDRHWPGTPVGEVRAVGEGQTIIYEGWAHDPSAPTTPVGLQLRFDSDSVDAVADQPNPDWASVPEGVGPQHGFRVQVDVPPFLIVACAVARNTGPGVDRPLPIEGPPDQPRTTYCVGIPD